MSSERPWLRITDRPEWGRDDVEWWWKRDDDMRVLDGDEVGRKCSTKNCPNEGWLVREQQIHRWDTGSRHIRRRFCCSEHVYSPRLVEDGVVYVRYPRFDHPLDIGLALAQTALPSPDSSPDVE